MADLAETRAYLCTLVMALLPIAAGSFSSLRMPKEARERLRAYHAKQDDHNAKKDGQDEEEEEDEEEIDRLTAEDAYLFPIIGSVVLFGLYLAFTYGPKDLINRILGGYIALMGCGSLARVMVKVGLLSMGRSRAKNLDRYTLALSKTTHSNNKSSEYVTATFTLLHCAALLSAIILQAFDLYRPSWIISNIIALSFAFNAISLLRLDSFFTGSMLLALLFIYDIWWVFGSKRVGMGDVMVTVAKSFDAPIKITFPKLFFPFRDFVLLGLGDIVLPGIFIALALRYDYSRALKLNPPPTPSARFAKPYFKSVSLAYVAGLVATISIMHTFKAAQPALLYLSPACIGSVVLCAVVRGEVKALWAFDDAADDDAREKKGQDNPGQDKADKKE